MEGIEVRTAATVDLPAILAIHREHGWDTPALLDEEWALLVSGTIVGGASLVAIEPGLVYLLALIVAEPFRGSGLGSHMLGALLETRTARWWTECRDSRVAFYERSGFILSNHLPAPLSIYLAKPGVLPSGRTHNFLTRASDPSHVREP